MLRKTWHFVVLVLAIIGAFGLYHMYFQHSGQQLIPGLGTK